VFELSKRTGVSGEVEVSDWGLERPHTVLLIGGGWIKSWGSTSTLRQFIHWLCNSINVKKLNSLKQCVRTTCFSHKTKTANIKKDVSPSITSPKCQCDAMQYNLFDICCFSFVTKTSRPYTLFSTVKFLHLYLLFYYIIFYNYNVTLSRHLQG